MDERNNQFSDFYDGEYSQLLVMNTAFAMLCEDCAKKRWWKNREKETIAIGLKYLGQATAFLEWRKKQNRQK